MKRYFLIFIVGLVTTLAFAQSDDDLFGSDDDFFGDDGIEEVADVSAKTDLSKGVLFDTGSIKVGGSLNAGISTNTILWGPDNEDLGDNIHNTTFTPDLSAMLSVDARPTETLRMYTKFGFAYPFEDKATTELKFTPVDFGFGLPTLQFATSAETSITNWFKLKELFTDFSIKDTKMFIIGFPFLLSFFVYVLCRSYKYFVQKVN